MSEEAFTRLPGTPEYAPGWNRTEVSRPVAIALSVLFCAGLVAIPLADFLLGSWQAPWRAVTGATQDIGRALRNKDESFPRRAINANRAALAGIEKFETSLEDSSQSVEAVRPATLDLLLRFGAAGSEEAYVGKDGWLFYRPDVDPLWMSRNAPAEAAAGLARFAADLAGRGVRVVFVAVPGKATIHPEKIGFGKFTRPVMPAGWENFSGEVARAWKEVAAPGAPPPMIVEATDLLWQRKQDTGQPQFLETDSHWSPQAMEAVAGEIAAWVTGSGALPQTTGVFREEKIVGVGDTARMLELPEGSVFLRPQRIEVARSSGWVPDPESEVLLLGDSYSNIYSAEDLGWGTQAGLAEQLSRFLGVPVDRLSRNDAGALEARQMLASAWSKDPQRFDGKKVIVWQLAMRELLRGDWSHVPLPEAGLAAPPGKNGSFLVVPPGAPLEVTGTILALGAMPRPEETPYADFLTAVHLGDLRDAASGNKLDGEALAYVFTMRDRRLLPAAELVAGQQVRARLLNYGENAGRLEQINRSELDDVELTLEQPNFAEWISPSSP